MKKIIKIVRIALIILGLILFTVAITVGRTTELLQPILTIMVQYYLYLIMFVIVITSLLEYIYRNK